MSVYEKHIKRIISFKTKLFASNFQTSLNEALVVVIRTVQDRLSNIEDVHIVERAVYANNKKKKDKKGKRNC